MVGSYLSKNVCCMNCIAKQDLPTPHSPIIAAFTKADMVAARRRSSWMGRGGETTTRAAQHTTKGEREDKNSKARTA